MENIEKSHLGLHPLYVTGFSDGEACFHLAIGKNTKYKIGYYVNPGFSIALHKKDENLLKLFKDSLNVGKIYKSLRRFMNYKYLP